MGYFAVTREAGPGWTTGQGITGQQGVDRHAAFMETLAAEGFVLLAGPLSGTEAGRLRALVIVRAEAPAEIRDRLADDPWALSGHLRAVRVEPWNIFVGAGRLDVRPARGR
jgi:uncharacterized protein YciI